MTRALATLAVLICADASAQTLFDRGPPEQRIVHRSLVAARLNPSGLVYDGRIGYRYRLYFSDSLALRDNYLGGGAALQVTPAQVRIGPYVEVAPASFATLWASFQLTGYFGTFRSLQSFPSPRASSSDDELERLSDLPDSDPLKNYSALGTELAIGVDLQAKAGPIVVRARNRFLRVDLNLREGDRVFYDQVTDTLVADSGWIFTSDVDVAWLGLDNRLAVGVRYTATLPVYPDSSYATGEPREHDNSSHRIGPLVAYSFFNRDGAVFNAPSVFLLVQWWVDHRYRTGAETSQALPLIGLGFQFYGDLLPFD